MDMDMDIDMYSPMRPWFFNSTQHESLHHASA